MASGHTSAQYALRDPDIRLMLRVRDHGDAAAFTELVELYRHRLVGVLTHLVQDPAEAEDLAQEVFLRVFKSRAKYRPRARFSTWLFTIANNLASNARRDRKRRHAAGAPGLSESGPLGPRPLEQLAEHDGEAPSGGLNRHELSQVVADALHELNERQRAAVVLNKFEEMGYAEIGEVMGLSVKAVKSLLSRARTRLRELLSGYIRMDGGPVTAGGGDEEDRA